MTEYVQLTPRLREVLEYIAQGLPDREIAQIQGVHESTVITRVRDLRWALDARNRAQCVAIAYQRKILKVED